MYTLQDNVIFSHKSIYFHSTQLVHTEINHVDYLCSLLWQVYVSYPKIKVRITKKNLI